MNNDIVSRLRESDGGYFMRKMFTEAADEIERLRKECFHLAANQCHAGYGGEYGHHRCAEIDRLTKERDEARHEICLLRASSTNATEKVSFEMIAYAASRGWDDLFADTGKHERDA